ncbi:hypothetical protein FACS1894106_0370 [Spirochaetia bacterium]|nr:hypothetical protein FACS1894106_0370 [Spirochaetia bacterium]
MDMEHNKLHSLIPLAEFKAILGIDDREDPLARFVLISSTYTIEGYCKRRLLKKKCLEYLVFTGDYTFTLGEYPVRGIINVEQCRLGLADPAPIDSNLYCCVPDYGMEVDLPVYLSLKPEIGLMRRRAWAIKVQYWAGYECGRVPPDLASACLELAAWNMSRYRGQRIGLTGAVRGKAADGEHLESLMPENVRLLLEPYRRKMI